MNIKDLIAQNMEKILNPTKAALARNKDRVLGKEKLEGENEEEFENVSIDALLKKEQWAEMETLKLEP